MFSAESIGWAQAMWNIANMHGAGQLGGPPDLLNACVWTLRAVKFADPNEQRLLQMASRVTAHLPRRLSGEQWAACQEQAFSWEPPRAALRSDKLRANTIQ